MSRYRLYPSPEQEAVLLGHCAQARYVWNRRFDVIRFEDLRTKTMTRSAKGTVENPGSNVRAKSGLNRAILAQGWGLLVRRTRTRHPAGWRR